VYRGSFEDATIHIDQYRRCRSSLDCPIVLCATKIDQRPTEKAMVSTAEAEEFCKKLKLQAYVETSAMTFQGVDACFETCCRLWLTLVVPGRAQPPKDKCVLC
jgi:GTPase SAR1 family protein